MKHPQIAIYATETIAIAAALSFPPPLECTAPILLGLIGHLAASCFYIPIFKALPPFEVNPVSLSRTKRFFMCATSMFGACLVLAIVNSLEKTVSAMTFFTATSLHCAAFAETKIKLRDFAKARKSP